MEALLIGLTNLVIFIGKVLSSFIHLLTESAYVFNGGPLETPIQWRVKRRVFILSLFILSLFDWIFGEIQYN
jgi:hypothetical protein